MKKIYRRGASIDTAFSVDLKCLSYQDDEKQTLASTVSADSQEKSNLDTKLTLKVRNWFHSIVKNVARWTYRQAKPLVRPVTSRWRRYLAEGVRQAVGGEVQPSFSPNALELSTQVVPMLSRIEKINSDCITRIQEIQGQNSAILAQLARIEQYSAVSVSRMAINCGSGELMIRTALGYIVCSASDHALIACLVESGDMEPGTRLLIQKFLNPGDVYIDIGANIGIHIIAAARAMQGAGKIIGFEPFEQTKQMLDKTVFLNGFSEITKIYQAAVSNFKGEEKLYLGKTSGHHTLYEQSLQEVGLQNFVVVPIVKLDDVIPSDEKIDLIKIDAEGAELAVIEGGASLIAKNPNVGLIVEFGPSHIRRSGHAPDQWIQTFVDAGFEYQVINEHTGKLEKWTPERLRETDSCNLFLARKDSKAWSRV